MRNLDELWRKRSTYNRQEVQKYMRFVFTGHMALVIVFLLGAGIFQYSHFLDTYHGDDAIPATLITALVVALFMTLSRPTTLIKKPDEVYLLPLETKLMTYFKHVLISTYTSQVVVSGLLFIIMWPMLRQVALLPISTIVIGLASVFVLKWLNVQQEFTYRWVMIGRRLWLNRFIRYVLNGGILYTLLEQMWLVAIILIIIFVFILCIIKSN
nr:ABC transporter permease [Kurthia senegalensis]